jgi:hypothetical protein
MTIKITASFVIEPRCLVRSVRWPTTTMADAHQISIKETNLTNTAAFVVVYQNGV